MSSLRQPNTPPDSLRDGRALRLRALAPSPATRRPRRGRLEGYRVALVLTMTAVVLIALVWLAPIEALNASDDAISWLEQRLTPTGQALATTTLATVALLALTLAWGRATALGRPVTLPAGGKVTVQEIATRLEQMIEARNDIASAEVRVENLHRRGVRVAARIHVASHANLTGAIQMVAEAAELLLHGHLLVRLSSPPSVEVHFQELDLRSGQAHDQRTSTAHR